MSKFWFKSTTSNLKKLNTILIKSQKTMFGVHNLATRVEGSWNFRWKEDWTELKDFLIISTIYVKKHDFWHVITGRVKARWSWCSQVEEWRRFSTSRLWKDIFLKNFLETCNGRTSMIMLQLWPLYSPVLNRTG